MNMKKYFSFGLFFIGYLVPGVLNVEAQSKQQRLTDSVAMSSQYWNLWNPSVQMRIDSAIDRNRKADAVIEIPGLPPGTPIKVEQLAHDFYFGANIFNFNQLGTSERNDKYKELFGSLFNSATVPFYWKTFEMIPNQLRFREGYWDTESFWNTVDSPKTQPHWRRPATDPIISFLDARGIRIKGHNMVWGNNKWQKPDWLFEQLCPEGEREAIDKLGGITAFGKLSADEMERIAPQFATILKKQYRKRVIELSQHYGDKIQCWDVVNESANDYHGELVTGTAYYDHSIYGVMPGDYTYTGFRTAQEYLPKDVKININDYANDLNYANQVKDLRAHGCRIDLLGTQMHLFNPQQCLDIAAGKPIESPQKVWSLMDTLAGAGLPIAVSEITITAPGDDARGRAIQAQITRNLYRLWFSIKDMAEVTWWNIVDDCGAPGEPTTSGLFTRNMEPKPSYYVLDQLINKEWKTRMNLRTGRNGSVRFRGFKGEYLISWKDKFGELKQAKFHLGKDGDGLTIHAK